MFTNTPKRAIEKKINIIHNAKEKMVASLKEECSFSNWYHVFEKISLEAEIVEIPSDVMKYLEHDAFLLPIEATRNATSAETEWSDGTAVDPDASEETEIQQTFPEFSDKIQSIIDNYDAVFIKSNWSAPLDAVWVSPTKTLKCTSLEDVYLLLKSSDRISQDLTDAKNLSCHKSPLNSCLILKKWREINPAYEFRCFVVNGCLKGICQRDVTQYYKYIEKERYDIQNDIKTVFAEKIKDKFRLDDYSFDVIRYKKDKVKLVDFGPLDETVTKGTLFEYKELLGEINNTPEFRYIAEEMGIQPKPLNHFCAPQEINEFYQSGQSVMDILRQEVENQNKDN